MKCLIFDPYCGASEKMILGALLGCGANDWRVKSAVEWLSEAPVHISDENRNGMKVKNIYIKEQDAKEWPVFLSREDALYKLNIMHEKEPVRTDAMKIVNMILDSLDEIHGKGSKIHIASVAMIGGICTAIDTLGRPVIQSTPAAMGGGMVDTRCGPMPVPLPETFQVLKGSNVITQGGPFDGELLTHEAAAVLSYYTRSSSRYYPEHKPLAIGYGAGDIDLPIPNVLRVTYCEVDDALIGDRIELLETNVDDVTGEVLGNLVEELLSMGARDVSIIPAMMKKGRSGHLIRVVAKADDGPAISRRIMLETGSLGVRVIPVKHRYIAKREINVYKITIGDNYYDMRFKVSSDMSGKVIDVSVEYEDAKLISQEMKVPLKSVMRMAEKQAWERFEKG
ncbi:hypothetical protein CUJ83_06240 [Methanocella sp. CWC-04]|uniref:Nickel insertion protein n=1 Tax=Methanooceanicella nereidis TaxID=2052831 RepID=A0AAP2RBN9_9EURY|nr:LarC family nickel insertion protein [Methanocella sp. CWC-04]MCD1294601.1 hypothetical protein [Methanocella sp. CWC-04]